MAVSLLDSETILTEILANESLAIPQELAVAFVGLLEQWISDEVFAREIRRVAVSEYQRKEREGILTSPIREMARVIEVTKHVMGILNLPPEEIKKIISCAIGDVYAENLPKDVADSLGVDYNFDGEEAGPKTRAISERAFQIFREEKINGYQLHAMGLDKLRKKFIEYLQRLGVEYGLGETLLQLGGLGSMQEVIQCVATQARATGQQPEFYNTKPGFLVFDAQAVDAGFLIKSLETCSELGGCPKLETLFEQTGDTNSIPAILVVTPGTNPTSEIYDPNALDVLVNNFLALRPNGYIFWDWAYGEYIPEEVLRELMAVMNQPRVKERSVSVESMSKQFLNTRLRCAAMHVTEPKLLEQLKQRALNVKASLPGDMEAKALAYQEMVSYDDREGGRNELRRRQRALVDYLVEKNIIDPATVRDDIALYVYAEVLDPEMDVAKLFIKTGIAAVPGKGLGDPNPRRFRFSVGIDTI